MVRIGLVLASFFVFAVLARANAESGVFTDAPAGCEDDLSSNVLAAPWAPEDHPFARVGEKALAYHRLDLPFAFTSDGKGVAIRHVILPDFEQVTFRALNGDPLVTSLRRRLKAQSRSDRADWAGIGQAFVNVARTGISDRSADTVTFWSGDVGTAPDISEIPWPQAAEAKATGAGVEPADTQAAKSEPRSPVFTHSEISLRQPYYVRTRKVGGKFLAQVVNWRSKRTMELPADADYAKVIPQPISREANAMAVLREGATDIELLPLGYLRALMLGEVGPDREPKSERASPRDYILAASQRLLARLQNVSRLKDSKGFKLLSQLNLSRAAMSEAQILSHHDPVEHFAFRLKGDFGIAQTKAGLHIWNLKTFQKIRFIPVERAQFRVLPKMNVLAYTDDLKKLRLLSLETFNPVAEFRLFNVFGMESRIENYNAGEVLVTEGNGAVTLVKETRDADGLPTYVSTPLAFRAAATTGKSFRTIIRVKERPFAVEILSRRQNAESLVVNVYDLTSPEQLGTISFPMHGYVSELGSNRTFFTLDPTGRHVLYTADQIATGMLDLQRLIEDSVEHSH